MPALHNTAIPTPTSGEVSHAQKDLKVAIPGAQDLTRAQLERDNKLKEASELIDTELLELPQRKELIREDGSLDIRTTYYEDGTMTTIPNVRIETVKDYRIKFGLGTNEGCYKEAAACPAGTKKNLRKECFLKTLKCCTTGKLLVSETLTAG